MGAACWQGTKTYDCLEFVNIQLIHCCVDSSQSKFSPEGCHILWRQKKAEVSPLLC